MIEQEVTTDLVRELFTYDPATGVIAWRHKHWNKPAGTVAGSLHKSTGYWRLNIRSQKYQAHRIAWLMHYGEWPQIIDHVNGDRADNRIENLRSVSHQTNAQNVHKPRKGTASSLLGASWHKSSGLWQAKIYKGGKYIHIGLFESEVDANNAYVQAKRLLHAGNTL